MKRCGDCPNCAKLDAVQKQALHTLASDPTAMRRYAEDVRLIWNRACEEFPCIAPFAEVDYEKPTRVEIGQKVRMVISHSEAAMHLRMAGRAIEAELVPGQYSPSAQLYFNGQPYSFPITYGEAGFYRDSDANGEYFYYYPPKE